MDTKRLYVSKRLEDDLQDLWMHDRLKLSKIVREKVYFVFSTIYLLNRIRGKTLDQFISVHSKRFEKVLYPKYSAKILRILKEINVGGEPLIDGDGRYLVGVAAMTYRIHGRYTKDIHVIESQRCSVADVYKYVEKKDYRYEDRISRYVKKILKETAFKNTLRKKCRTLDSYEDDITDEMIDLECLILTSFNSPQRLSSHRTKNGGRLFHSVSNIKRIYRPFLEIQNQKTVEIDVSSSQPLLLVTLYDKYQSKYKGIHEERQRYYDLVKSGRLYASINEKFDEVFGPTFDFEDEENYSYFKELFFGQVLYSPNGGKDRPLWKVFQMLFPILSKILIAEKRNHGKERNRYKKFNHEMQFLESKVFVDGLCRWLMEEGIPFIPIHDSVIVPKQYRRTTVSQLKRIYMETYDLEPNVKVK